MWQKILTMLFSLVMFASVFYGIAAFYVWQCHPALWSDWLRALVAVATLACWVWDGRR